MPSDTAITASAPSSADLLAPARQRVAAAELLGLPRPQRLERVHGRHVRDAVDELRQVPGEVRVPGVAVHDLGALDGGRHREVDRHRAQRRQVRRVARQRVPRLVADRALAVVAPRVDGDVLEPRELAREVLDVHARAAVDLGRVLAREQRDLHASTTGALADHHDAAVRDGEALAVGLGSTPICAPGAIRTFLSRIALPHDRVAADVDAVHQHESSTSA